MRKHWLYLKYVIRHKWYVFLECLKYGLVWRGIKHDYTKLLPSEWFPYVEYFYGEKAAHPKTKVFKDGDFVPLMEPPEHVKRAFDAAWNHHQKRNRHHWQYWLLTPDNPRPNLWFQSHDGGMTHVTVTDAKGRNAALVYYHLLQWWKADPEAEKQLLCDLKNTPIPLPMPDADRKEMLADWRGAGKALGKPNTWEWYNANKDNMFLHPDTRPWVEGELAKQEAYYRALISPPKGA